jgi:hypothetical protein
LVEPVQLVGNETKELLRERATPVLLSALNVTLSPSHFSGLEDAVSAKANGLKRLNYLPQQMPWKNLPHTHW